MGKKFRGERNPVTANNPPIKLSIIIVNWNVSEHLLACLSSLKLHCKDIEHEIIVVDNASSDDSVYQLSKLFPNVILLKNERNYGFAIANNQGFSIARGEYILILNPDCLVTERSIEHLILRLKLQPKVGLVGPKLVDLHGFPVPSSKRKLPRISNLLAKRLMLEKGFLFLCRNFSLLRQLYLKTFLVSGPTECLQGSCIMMRSKDLQIVGFFDTTLPMYLDDIDLCKRFLDSGFIVFYEALSEVVHVGGASVNRLERPKMMDLMPYVAVDYYFKKHASFAFVIAHHFILVLSALLLLVCDLVLLPTFIVRKRSGLQIMTKHFSTLIYGFTGRCEFPNFNLSVKLF